MSKIAIKPNPKMTIIWEELEGYLEFCQLSGYKYNEADIGNMRSYSYQQFCKKQAGKNYKDQWADDARKFGITL